MAKEAITNASIYYGAHNVSSLTNVIGGLAVEIEVQDSTTFGSGGWKESLGSLKAATWPFEGLFDGASAGPHPDIFTGAVAPVTVSKTNPIAAGDLAWMLNCLKTSDADSHVLGELHKWTWNFVGDGTMARGICLDTQALSATGSGTGQQHGAVSSTQTLYAALHVVAFNGTSLDVKIQSDDNSGFTSATDRITFTQATGVTSQRSTLAGAITDDWWRADWTFVGTSATIVVFIGIQ